MKKTIKNMLILATILCANFFFSCAESTITVTFKQDGQPTITKQVAVGESLTDIPQPKSIDGYTITWDRTDFTSLNNSITVTAVATPNVYTIHYNVGEGTILENEETLATYMKEFTLEIPSLKGYTFVGWKQDGEQALFENGVYTWTEDIELMAVWSVDNKSDYTYFY